MSDKIELTGKIFLDQIFQYFQFYQWHQWQLFSTTETVFEQQNNSVYEAFGHQKQVSQISNCIPQNTVGCNYLSLTEIPASGTKEFIYIQMVSLLGSNVMNNIHHEAPP